MKHYILDANALVRFVRNTEGASRVRGIFRQSEQGVARISMSVINLGEAFYVFMRRGGEEAALDTVNVLQQAIAFVPVDFDLAIEAATIKERYKLAYADSFAAALAIRVNGVLVSADSDFMKLGKSIQLIKLPRYVEN